MQPVLDGGGDAGLVRPVEGHGGTAVRDGRGGVPVAGQRRGAAGHGGTEGEAAAGGEDGTAGGAAPGGRFGRHLTTAAASLESGSASALTPSDSSLRAGSPTLS